MNKTAAILITFFYCLNLIAQTDPNVVATIEPYTITGDQFKQRYIQQLFPNPYTAMPPRPAPEPNEVLMQLLGDKAIILDARQRGLHTKEEIASLVKRTFQIRLANMAANQAVAPLLEVTEKDINDVLATNQRLTRQQAESIAKNRKAMQLLDQHVAELAQRFNLQKDKENIAKVAALHERLITKPKPPEKKNIYWIENIQIKIDLDANERELVLARYNGGQFTVEDWFNTLCMEIAPPRRPKDLSTPEGAERFLDSALRMPLLVAEAIAKGMDQDQQFKQYIRDFEDDLTLGFAQQELYKDINEPNNQQARSFFQTVKDVYAKNDCLKVAVIWCPDKPTAVKIRQELEQGRPFELLQQRYQTDPKTQQPIEIYPSTEGHFWYQLWSAEPNQTVGPILGFKDRSLAWRLVKIIEKRPAKSVEFEQILNKLKEDMVAQMRQQALDSKRKVLLARYPYKVFPDRLQAFDPRDVP